MSTLCSGRILQFIAVNSSLPVSVETFHLLQIRVFGPFAQRLDFGEGRRKFRMHTRQRAEQVCFCDLPLGGRSPVRRAIDCKALPGLWLSVSRISYYPTPVQRNTVGGATVAGNGRHLLAGLNLKIR